MRKHFHLLDETCSALRCCRTCNVRKSARIWIGWYRSDRPLMIGIEASLSSSSSVEWLFTRAKTISQSPERTLWWKLRADRGVHGRLCSWLRNTLLFLQYQWTTRDYYFYLENNMWSKATLRNTMLEKVFLYKQIKKECTCTVRPTNGLPFSSCSEHSPGCVCATLIHSQVDVLRGEETGMPTQQSKTCK